MTPVLSSHILAVGYDAQAGGVIVEFVDGASVVYPGLGPEVAQRLATAPSPGAALHALKKDGVRFRYLSAPLRPPRRRR